MIWSDRISAMKKPVLWGPSGGMGVAQSFSRTDERKSLRDRRSLLGSGFRLECVGHATRVFRPIQAEDILMRRALLSGALALAVLGLTLTTPNTSNADHRRRGYSFSFSYGPSYGYYHRGYYGGYARPLYGARYYYYPEVYVSPYRSGYRYGYWDYVPTYRYRSYRYDPYYCW
jgi:hypothetical protein